MHRRIGVEAVDQRVELAPAASSRRARGGTTACPPRPSARSCAGRRSARRDRRPRARSRDPAAALRPPRVRARPRQRAREPNGQRQRRRESVRSWRPRVDDRRLEPQRATLGVRSAIRGSGPQRAGQTPVLQARESARQIGVGSRSAQRSGSGPQCEGLARNVRVRPRSCGPARVLVRSSGRVIRRVHSGSILPPRRPSGALAETRAGGCAVQRMHGALPARATHVHLTCALYGDPPNGGLIPGTVVADGGNTRGPGAPSAAQAAAPTPVFPTTRGAMNYSIRNLVIAGGLAIVAIARSSSTRATCRTRPRKVRRASRSTSPAWTCPPALPRRTSLHAAT